MKNTLIAGLLFASLFLLGCQAAANAQTGAGASGGSGASASIEASASARASATAGTTDGASAGVQASAGASVDLTDVTYGALLESGAPVKCDTTVRDAQTGVVSTSKVNFRKNGAAMQMHSYTTLSGTGSAATEGQEFEVISKGDTVYTKVSGTAATGGVSYGDCAWLSITAAPSATGGATAESTDSAPEANDFEKPDVKYSCEPAVFTDAEFTPSGKTCSMEDILKNLQASAAAGAGVDVSGYGTG